MDEYDCRGLRTVDVGQILQDRGVVDGGAPVGDLDVAPAFERRKRSLWLHLRERLLPALAGVDEAAPLSLPANLPLGPRAACFGALALFALPLGFRGPAPFGAVAPPPISGATTATAIFK